MVNSLTESDVRARGTPVLDVYLAQEADRAGKPLAAVELVEEHCLPLNAMNLSQVAYRGRRLPLSPTPALVVVVYIDTLSIAMNVSVCTYVCLSVRTPHADPRTGPKI